MFRTFAAFAIFAIGLTAVAAPGPKEKGADFYYPTKVGDKLVYEVRVDNVTIELIDLVTLVENKDGALVVSTRRESSDDETPFLSTASVTDQGVFRTASNGSEARPPIPILKVRAKPGDSWIWESDGSDDGNHPKMKCTMGKVEEIEIPAGKYWAIRIESEHYLATQTITSVCWHAPRIGLIKVVSKVGRSERVQMLKSFTPGE